MYKFALHRTSVIILTPPPLHTHSHSIVKLCRKGVSQTKREAFFKKMCFQFFLERGERWRDADVCRKGVLFIRLAVCVFCLSGWLCVCSVYQAGCVCFLFARLEENYEIADGVCIPRSTLYYHYLHFCEANDTQPVNAASFGKVNLVTGTGKPGHRDR